MAGNRLRRKDREAVVHLWRYIAYIVGVHPNLIPATESDTSRLLWMFLDEVIAPDAGSTELGTALIDAYPGSDAFFRRNHPVARALVLLPHTVRAYPDLLAAMDARCILFAREAESHAYLTRHCPRAQVGLCHDLAFFLSPASIRAESWSLAHLRQNGLLGPWLRMAVKFGLVARARSATLSIFRDDAEKTAIPLPPGNCDLSVFFNSDDKSRPGCANTAKVLSQVFRPYRQIDTNRLHMAILAALSGKAVRMFDNSYGKNRAIYEHSIRDVFPGVSFLPEQPKDG